jgi:hypothetical protein
VPRITGRCSQLGAGEYLAERVVPITEQQRTCFVQSLGKRVEVDLPSASTAALQWRFIPPQPPVQRRLKHWRIHWRLHILISVSLSRLHRGHCNYAGF